MMERRRAQDVFTIRITKLDNDSHRYDDTHTRTHSNNHTCCPLSPTPTSSKSSVAIILFLCPLLCGEAIAEVFYTLLWLQTSRRRRLTDDASRFQWRDDATMLVGVA